MRANYFLVCGLLAFVTSCTSYLPVEPTTDNPDYQETETADYILLEPNSTAVNDAILFVPGGLVDPHAYVQTFDRFVTENQQKVVILKVRSNLAIYNTDLPLRVKKDFPELRFYIGGHSLGGVVAAMAIRQAPDDFGGLFLMGSYSTKNISDWTQPVVSFWGGNDGVASLTDAEKYASNLPAEIKLTAENEVSALPDGTGGKTIFYTIQGGNHGQFGNYGTQKGDGKATITTDAQHAEFYRVLTTIMRKNGVQI